MDKINQIKKRVILPDNTLFAASDTYNRGIVIGYGDNIFGESDLGLEDGGLIIKHK